MKEVICFGNKTNNKTMQSTNVYSDTPISLYTYAYMDTILYNDVVNNALVVDYACAYAPFNTLYKMEYE